MKRWSRLFTLVVTVVLLAGLYVWLEDPAARLEPGPRHYTLDVRGMRVVSGPTVLGAVQGDEITLVLTSDRPGMIYIHGYERMADVEPAVPVTLTFAAEHAGRYGVHVHASDNTHTEVAALEVQPR